MRDFWDFFLSFFWYFMDYQRFLALFCQLFLIFLDYLLYEGLSFWAEYHHFCEKYGHLSSNLGQISSFLMKLCLFCAIFSTFHHNLNDVWTFIFISFYSISTHFIWNITHFYVIINDLIGIMWIYHRFVAYFLQFHPIHTTFVWLSHIFCVIFMCNTHLLWDVLSRASPFGAKYSLC